MRILGVDPGTVAMGYGVIEANGDEMVLVDCGALVTKGSSPIGERLSFLYHGLMEIIQRCQPDAVAIEQPFLAKNVKSALAVGRAQAVAMLAAANQGISTYEYTPTQVKQRVANYGASSKEQIQEMVKLQLGLSQVPQPNDAADALAVAICHLGEMHLSNLLAEQWDEGEMIAGLHGRLESLGGDWAIIGVGGVSFRVYMPTSTLSTLGTIGEEVKLHTHLHLREDDVTLYGFASPDELRLFQTVIGVSGVGPRLALAMLSAMNVEQLVMAIAGGSAEMLTMVPGIGKKTASRLILELKDKIGAGWVVAPATQIAQENTDVIAVLTSLGYSVAEASRAVATLPSDQNLSLEEKIKLALQYFGGK